MKKWGGDWRMNLMGVGGMAGAGVALAGAHILGWHDDFLRASLLGAGGIVGGLLGLGPVYERCFDKNDDPFPRTAKILGGLYAVLVVLDKLIGAAMTIPCIFGRHRWVAMPYERQHPVLGRECERCHKVFD